MTLPFGTFCISVTAQTICVSPPPAVLPSCRLPVESLLIITSFVSPEAPTRCGVDVGDGVADSDICDWDLYPELDGLKRHDTELAPESVNNRENSILT